MATVVGYQLTRNCKEECCDTKGNWHRPSPRVDKQMKFVNPRVVSSLKPIHQLCRCQRINFSLEIAISCWHLSAAPLESPRTRSLTTRAALSPTSRITRSQTPKHTRSLTAIVTRSSATGIAGASTSRHACR